MKELEGQTGLKECRHRQILNTFKYTLNKARCTHLVGWLLSLEAGRLVHVRMNVKLSVEGKRGMDITAIAPIGQKEDSVSSPDVNTPHHRSLCMDENDTFYKGARLREVGPIITALEGLPF
jgi:hypothetical protein